MTLLIIFLFIIASTVITFYYMREHTKLDEPIYEETAYMPWDEFEEDLALDEIIQRANEQHKMKKTIQVVVEDEKTASRRNRYETLMKALGAKP